MKTTHKNVNSDKERTKYAYHDDELVVYDVMRMPPKERPHQKRKRKRNPKINIIYFTAKTHTHTPTKHRK